jgi:hypothetical protein
MARWIGVDVLAVGPDRAQRRHPWPRGRNVLHHDVEVKLLRHCGTAALRDRASSAAGLPGARWNARPEDASLTAATTQSSSRYVTGNPGNVE